MKGVERLLREGKGKVDFLRVSQKFMVKCTEVVTLRNVKENRPIQRVRQEERVYRETVEEI